MRKHIQLTFNKNLLAGLGYDYDTCVEEARTGTNPATLVQMKNDIMSGKLPDVGGFSGALVAKVLKIRPTKFIKTTQTSQTFTKPRRLQHCNHGCHA